MADLKVVVFINFSFHSDLYLEGLTPGGLLRIVAVIAVPLWIFFLPPIILIPLLAPGRLSKDEACLICGPPVWGDAPILGCHVVDHHPATPTPPTRWIRSTMDRLAAQRNGDRAPRIGVL